MKGIKSKSGLRGTFFLEGNGRILRSGKIFVREFLQVFTAS